MKFSLQVGHAGTLDPMATGLLIVCVGKATKIVERLSSIFILMCACVRVYIFFLNLLELQNILWKNGCCSCLWRKPFFPLIPAHKVNQNKWRESKGAL